MTSIYTFERSELRTMQIMCGDDNVIEAIVKLKTLYPKARIQISTIGIPRSVYLVTQLIGLEHRFGKDWLELQFSIHSTDDEFREWLQTKSIIMNHSVGALAKHWYESFPNRPWKATLNFALAKDTPFDASLLKKQFDPKTVFIKVSPINANPVSEENKLDTLFAYENSI